MGSGNMSTATHAYSAGMQSLRERMPITAPIHHMDQSSQPLIAR
eukprot:CAMPEP_0172783192 /NCGR_PEP_ID=MMETSP1074-20121228/204310_1 /TAXON_ID=2916 /ORGANISM="Ceratium fusus, Strain PA161109" /LENGTH=43 /DNA_ID= /DNA_START= /DNA_END= /DNA_ORIENTATION=